MYKLESNRHSKMAQLVTCGEVLESNLYATDFAERTGKPIKTLIILPKYLVVVKRFTVSLNKPCVGLMSRNKRIRRKDNEQRKAY